MPDMQLIMPACTVTIYKLVLHHGVGFAVQLFKTSTSRCLGLLCKPIANVLPAVEEELPDDHYVITDRVVPVNMATSRVVVIMPRPLYRVDQDAGFYEVRRNGWLAMDCAGYA